MPSARSQITVAAGFSLETVATGLPTSSAGICVAPATFGSFEGHVFIVDNGDFGVLDDGRILRVDPADGSFSEFAEVDGDPQFAMFGPGGAFGTDMYVSSNQDPAELLDGIVYTVDEQGDVSEFGTQTPNLGLDYVQGGVGLAFSVSGSFGTALYSGCSGGAVSDCISTLPSSGGTASLFHGFGTPLSGSPLGLAFGSQLDGFNGDLFFGVKVSSGGSGIEDGVHSLDAAGVLTPLATESSSPLITSSGINDIAFGQGGVFGNGLYASQKSGPLLHIDAAGTVTEVAGLGNPFGLAFDGPDVLYVMDRSTGTLYRLVESLDPWSDLGGGTVGIAGQPVLTMGGPLTPSSTVTLDLVDGAPLALALLFVSFSSSPASFLGGTLHAFPFDELVVIGTDGAGEIHGSAFFPGAPTGQGLWFQLGIADASVPSYGASLSNAVKGTVP